MRKRKPKTEARSAGEAFEKMVQEKKLPRKINYDVLKDLDPSAFKADVVTDGRLKSSAESEVSLFTTLLMSGNIYIYSF